MQIVAAAVLFSTGGAVIKSCTMTSWQIAGFRSGFAALALILFIPAARRGWSIGSVLVGTAYAATMILFVSANGYTTAANTIFLQDTAPLYVMLLAPLVLHERASRRDAVFMSIVAVGIVMFFLGAEPRTRTAPDPMRGNILAAIAGLTWAFVIMGLRRLGRDKKNPTATINAVAVGNLIAMAVCLPLAFPVVAGTAHNWLLVAFLGVFQIGLAYLLLTRGIVRVTALQASMLLLIEPLLNPVWAFFAHGEVPGRWAMAGGVLVLGAVAAKSVGDGRR